MSVTTVTASDLEREKRWEQQVIDVIFDGEPVYLQANSHRFMGIYMESEDESAKSAVIILHERGYHPDWKDAVNPLRVGLPEHGWHTLSLQMPVLDKQAKYYDYVPIFPEAHPRIEAGIRFLRDKGIQKIVLIAHGCGAHMAMSWIDTSGGKGIDAYIGIGMGATDYKQPMRKPFPLAKMKIPVLDVYGQDEYPAVINMAVGRKKILEQKGHTLSRQVVVPDANHYFTDMGEPLLQVISDWLETVH